MTSRGVDTHTLSGELDRIVARASGVPVATLDAAGDRVLAELGLDSLASMEFQAAALARFGVRIPDDSLEMSLPQITRCISARLAEGA
jgi:acyl carrier protein